MAAHKVRDSASSLQAGEEEPGAAHVNADSPVRAGQNYKLSLPQLDFLLLCARTLFRGRALCGPGLPELTAMEDRGDGCLQVFRRMTKALSISELPACFLRSESPLIGDRTFHLIRGRRSWKEDLGASISTWARQSPPGEGERKASVN